MLYRVKNEARKEEHDGDWELVTRSIEKLMQGKAWMTPLGSLGSV